MLSVCSVRCVTYVSGRSVRSFNSSVAARAGRARPLLVNTRDLCIYQTNPGLSAPPLVGLRSKVIEMNAPTHDPEAAKPTYIQFFV